MITLVRKSIVVAFALGCTALASGQDAAALAKLRADCAQRFCEPLPHVALAKDYHSRGKLLMAFCILEGARLRFDTKQERAIAAFGPGTFADAFDVLFLGRPSFDNGPAAQAKLEAALAADPKSVETLKSLADLFVSREDYEHAEPLLRTAIELAPADFELVTLLGEVLEQRGDEKGAAKERAAFLKRAPDSEDALLIRVERLMNSDPKKAKQMLTDELAKRPKAGRLRFALGTLLQDDGDQAGAEAAYVEAAALEPADAHIQGWTGRYFLKVKEDLGKALAYQLAAYFLDTEFYDSEYAEYRIKIIARTLADDRRKQLLAAGTKLETLLGDEDPFVVEQTLRSLEPGDAAKLKARLIGLLSHDVESLRAEATELLRAKDVPWTEPELKKLLQDPDPRVRGCTAYIALGERAPTLQPLVTRWLDDPSQLLRYDAVSTLATRGGAKGKEAVRKRGAKEPVPFLKRVIDAALK